MFYDVFYIICVNHADSKSDECQIDANDID